MDSLTPIRQAGHRHGIVGKARGSLTDFLVDSGRTRAPYYPVSVEMRANLRRAFLDYWAAELKEEPLLSH